MSTNALACLLALAPAVVAGDDDRHVAKGARAARLAEAVDRCAAVGFSGAVLAARGGDVLFAGGVGFADLEGQVPNTANTLFELASATKQFTGAAICELVEQRKLGLDDPISEHLPGVPESCAAITVRHLLQHTSGIPGSNSRGGGDDLAAVVPVFLEGGPQHEVGTHWEYWNQGYALLAGIIERASGDGYGDFCTKALFAKAKMKSTRFTGDDAPRGSVVAVGSSANGAPRSALEHPYGSYGYQYRGMGGAVSNVWDLWRWDRALAGTKVLKEKTKRELFSPGLNDYALGWFVREAGGRAVQSHGGSVRGFVCEVKRFPDDDGAVFVLANRDGFPVYRVSGLVEAVLFDADHELPPPPLAAAAQAGLVGEYAGPDETRLTIASDGVATRLTIDWAGRYPDTLAYVCALEDGAPVLYEWDRLTPLELDLDDDGSVRAVTLSERVYSR